MSNEPIDWSKLSPEEFAAKEAEMLIDPELVKRYPYAFRPAAPKMPDEQYAAVDQQMTDKRYTHGPMMSKEQAAASDAIIANWGAAYDEARQKANDDRIRANVARQLAERVNNDA